MTTTAHRARPVLTVAHRATRAAAQHLLLLTLLPVVLTAALSTRMRARLAGDGLAKDAGIGVIESVVIGLGMLLLATAVVAVITLAVNGRLAQIV